MALSFALSPKFRPVLDPDFVPASLWRGAYRNRLAACGGGIPFALALERADGAVSTLRTATLPHEGADVALNQRYAERLLKFLLWQKGGWRVWVGGGAAAGRFSALGLFAGGRARVRLPVYG
jgi:hypothetical protein